MKTQFPFESWTKPGQDAFEFWISFFPTAPLFGVEWRFASMTNPAMNPFLMPGMPGMRAAAVASHPGELDSPATANEEAAKPVARTAEAAGNAARDMTRIAGETSRATARTADTAMKAGADAAKQVVEAQSKAVDSVEAAGETARESSRTAAKAAEDVTKTAGAAAESTSRQAKSATLKAADEATKTGKAGAEAKREAADKAVAAAPKPKRLLDKRPDNADDLKLIKGVGPDLERQLNELGLYRFDQLAKMSDTELAWIDANITRFKGRCYRDDWVGQAKARLSK